MYILTIFIKLIINKQVDDPIIQKQWFGLFLSHLSLSATSKGCTYQELVIKGYKEQRWCRMHFLYMVTKVFPFYTPQYLHWANFREVGLIENTKRLQIIKCQKMSNWKINIFGSYYAWQNASLTTLNQYLYLKFHFKVLFGIYRALNIGVLDNLKLSTPTCLKAHFCLHFLIFKIAMVHVECDSIHALELLLKLIIGGWIANSIILKKTILSILWSILTSYYF